MMKHCLALACLLVSTWHQAQAAEAAVLSRNYMIHNDFRNDSPTDKSLTHEWAQGFIGQFSSDITPGTVGLGVDLHGFLGVKLDGGRGHAGTGLLPIDSDHDNRSHYASAGGSLRIVHGDTTLSVGEMTVATPVFDTGDKRLKPEYATGWLLTNRSVSGVSAQAGRFTAFSNQDPSSSHDDFSGYGASTRFGGISLIGATWALPGQSFGGALYAARLDETWQQAYANLNATHGPWFLDANLYRTRDWGAARAGRIDNTAYSLLASLAQNTHTLSLGFQRISGDTPFDFVGGDSVYLANSVKYADFNGPGERSLQARYQWTGLDAGLAGLSFSARYVRGWGIDGTHAQRGGVYNPFDTVANRFQPAQGRGGKHWERDIDLRYVVQTGEARGLSLSLAYVTHRASAAQAGADIDRIYFIAEYPLSIIP